MNTNSKEIQNFAVIFKIFKKFAWMKSIVTKNVDFGMFIIQLFFRGKSLSEALILVSINPQYDKRLSNFTMGTILGKGFAQAQVHTNHSASAEGTSAVMYARVLVQNPFPRLSPWRSCIL